MPSVHLRRVTLLCACSTLALSAMACGSPGYPKKVRAETDAPNTSCESSHACKVWGWCAEKAGQCVAASDDHCRSSQSCKQGGLCSLSVDRCIAKTSDDCGQSEWCDKYDFCTASQGVCR